jgi:hypothetical protein
VFAKTLKVRFTQPSGLNDPFEFRPLVDFEATAAGNRDEVHARLTESFGTVDGALAMERQQATDPNYPKLIVPIHIFRKMLVANPGLERQFMAQMQRHMAEILDNARMAANWEVEWEKVQQALGQSFGIFSLTEDPIHMLMWSHYASQHTGVVVEFDEKHPWFDQRRTPVDEFRHMVQVTYVRNPQPRKLGQLNGAD